MLHGTFPSSNIWSNVALQHCCDIVSNGCNIVPTLQRCVALKIIVANRLVQHKLQDGWGKSVSNSFYSDWMCRAVPVTAFSGIPHGG